MGSDLSRQKNCGATLMDELVAAGHGLTCYMMEKAPRSTPEAERWALSMNLYANMREKGLPFQCCLVASDLIFVTQDAISLLFKLALRLRIPQTDRILLHIEDFVRIGYCPREVLEMKRSNPMEDERQRESACFYCIM